MTTPDSAPRRRSFYAAVWLRECAVRDAQAISDPEERAAALAEVDRTHPQPTRSTYRRTPR